MEINKELVRRLSVRGILAYVAVAMAGDGEATTAALAGVIRAQPTVIREGLKELAVEAPALVRPGKRGKWMCGTGQGTVHNLDLITRYRELVDDLQKYWMFLNPAIPFSLSGADGVAIRQVLQDHPQWTAAEWLTALRNRARSVSLYGHGSRTEDFARWVRRLGDYMAGPLNQFNKPVEGSGNAGKTVALEQSNRAAKEAYLAGHSIRPGSA